MYSDDDPQTKLILIFAHYAGDAHVAGMRSKIDDCSLYSFSIMFSMVTRQGHKATLERTLAYSKVIQLLI